MSLNSSYNGKGLDKSAWRVTSNEYKSWKLFYFATYNFLLFIFVKFLEDKSGYEVQTSVGKTRDKIGRDK